MERVLGHRVNVIVNPEKAGGVPRLTADISRARELLGFNPRIDLAAGLRLILERDSRFGTR
jgi:nucleoside-diphosphate-sugar epimerase